MHSTWKHHEYGKKHQSRSKLPGEIYEWEEQQTKPSPLPHYTAVPLQPKPEMKPKLAFIGDKIDLDQPEEEEEENQEPMVSPSNTSEPEPRENKEIMDVEEQIQSPQSTPSPSKEEEKSNATTTTTNAPTTTSTKPTTTSTTSTTTSTAPTTTTKSTTTATPSPSKKEEFVDPFQDSPSPMMSLQLNDSVPEKKTDDKNSIKEISSPQKEMEEKLDLRTILLASVGALLMIFGVLILCFRLHPMIHKFLVNTCSTSLVFLVRFLQGELDSSDYDYKKKKGFRKKRRRQHNDVTSTVKKSEPKQSTVKKSELKRSESSVIIAKEDINSRMNDLEQGVHKPSEKESVKKKIEANSNLNSTTQVRRSKSKTSENTKSSDWLGIRHLTQKMKKILQHKSGEQQSSNLEIKDSQQERVPLLTSENENESEKKIDPRVVQFLSSVGVVPSNAAPNLFRDGYERWDSFKCATIDDLLCMGFKKGRARLILSALEKRRKEKRRKNARITRRTISRGDAMDHISATSFSSNGETSFDDTVFEEKHFPPRKRTRRKKKRRKMRLAAVTQDISEGDDLLDTENSRTDDHSVSLLSTKNASPWSTRDDVSLNETDDNATATKAKAKENLTAAGWRRERIRMGPHSKDATGNSSNNASIVKGSIGSGFTTKNSVQRIAEYNESKVWASDECSEKSEFGSETEPKMTRNREENFDGAFAGESKVDEEVDKEREFEKKKRKERKSKKHRETVKAKKLRLSWADDTGDDTDLVEYEPQKTEEESVEEEIKSKSLKNEVKTFPKLSKHKKKKKSNGIKIGREINLKRNLKNWKPRTFLKTDNNKPDNAVSATASMGDTTSTNQTKYVEWNKSGEINSWEKKK
eukprot:g4406.t1